MNKNSKYRPLLDKVEDEIMQAEVGVTGVYRYMLDALDEAETVETALREELAALKAENAKLNSVVCQTCHGAGSVCSAPDDCYNCPACTATYNKIRADAIRDMLANLNKSGTFKWEHRDAIIEDTINEYAKKIEDES